MSNKTITVIIPVHKLTKATTELFKKAIESVNNQKVKPEELMIVTPKKTAKKINEILGGMESMTVNIVENPGATDFASQINLGVEKLNTTHFSLLEYDDEFSPIWLDNVHKYLKAHPDKDMYLPIIVDMSEEGKFIGFTNEPVWANEFSEVMGEIDNATLLRYNNFNFDGMVMSKEKYQEFGGLKPSMKLTFPYEFLLRVTNFAGKIMVIPKFGYKHVAARKGSLFEGYQESMTMDERRWWLATAKKEYFHVNDREITYEK
jgi:hypothetical protein